MLNHLLLLALSASAATSHAEDEAVAASRLAWLAGCWIDEDGGAEEHWMAPAGGSLLGMSRTIREGRTAAYEFLRISETSGSSLELVALPSGQAEARFPLARLTEGQVVFENPAHDFPQRIAYRLDSPSRLEARIEGSGGAQPPRVIRFSFIRTPCITPQGS